MRQNWFARRAKQRAELAWWQEQRAAEGGELHAAHYELLFTAPFGLTAEDFRDRAILDVGCGPRGSLEWASAARERIGLDPLAARYAALGTGRHRMRYVAARAERIPFDDGHFDVVAVLNALDHVDDLERAIAEIGRVVAVGGLLLLIVEVEHEPTATEPQRVGWDAPGLFGPGFTTELERRFAKRGGVHDSVLVEPAELGPEARAGKPGVLVARLRRAA